MKIEPLSMDLCKNCGHAMHYHTSDRGPCAFCQTSPYSNCSCSRFQFPGKEKAKELPKEERQKLACAAHLGINPISIRSIEPVTHGNQLIGLNVVVYIFTGDELGRWEMENLPNDEDWVLKYIEWLKKQPVK